MLGFKIFLLIALLTLFGSSSILAQSIYTYSASEISEKKQEQLKKVAISPIKIGFSWDGEMVNNYLGGREKGMGYFGKIGLNISLSLKDMGVRNGGQFFIHAINVHGDSPTDRLIGDFQPISRNEASPRSGLFELWYKHNFGNTTIIVGQHDMNSSFGTSDIAGNSVHSAFGVFPSVSPNLGYAFSIYPRTMPGIYLRYNRPNISVNAALYSGASHPFSSDKHNLKWNLKDAGFLISEVQYHPAYERFKNPVYKLGIFKHTGSFPKLETGDAQTVKSGIGLYLIMDQPVFYENSSSKEGLAIFAEATYFPGKQNMAKNFVALGFGYRGLIPNRVQDKLFFGFLNTSLSNAGLTRTEFDEEHRSIIELNYLIEVGSGLSIKPDLQYIINPGGNSEIGNALLSIIKMSYKF